MWNRSYARVASSRRVRPPTFHQRPHFGRRRPLQRFQLFVTHRALLSGCVQEYSIKPRRL